jgi:hypothetical protein
MQLPDQPGHVLSLLPNDKADTTNTIFRLKELLYPLFFVLAHSTGQGKDKW